MIYVIVYCRIERVADEDYKLSDTGLIVPKGMIISIPVYAIHKDPKNFPDPEKFNPDRYLFTYFFLFISKI